MPYNKTDWENLPSTNTPLNDSNLQKIEDELEALDNKVSTGTVNNSSKWNGLIDDRNTVNTTDTWIPVYATDKMQHTTISNLVSRGDTATTTSKGLMSASDKSRVNIAVKGYRSGWSKSFTFPLESGEIALVMMSHSLLLQVWHAGGEPTTGYNIGKMGDNGNHTIPTLTPGNNQVTLTDSANATWVAFVF